jgi:hypothetical protein
MSFWLDVCEQSLRSHMTFSHMRNPTRWFYPSSHFGLNYGSWLNLLIWWVGIKYKIFNSLASIFWMLWLCWALVPHNINVCERAHLLTCSCETSHVFWIDVTRQPWKCVNKKWDVWKIVRKVNPPKNLWHVRVYMFLQAQRLPLTTEVTALWCWVLYPYA